VSVIPDRRSIRGDAFWSSISPCDHFLQVYRNEVVFLDALEGFVGSGLRAGEAVIVIATARNIHELEKRLRARWIDVDRARWQGNYLPVLAQETLSKFMVDGFPDEELFDATARKLIAQARGDGRKVRSFSEMVALLWAQGNAPATIRLELLWSGVCRAESLPVFCAYSQEVFDRDASAPAQLLCAAHSQLLPG
jgi:uncharacterized protein YoaH (UPF0181 family)